MEFRHYLSRICTIPIGDLNAAVRAQVDDYEDLIGMKFKEAENVCKYIRKPGGGEDGHLLSIPWERCLQMLAYEVNHNARIQRVFNPPDGDNVAPRNRFKAALRSTWQVYEQERARPALADLPEPCLKDEDIRKSLDDFHEWAKDSYGNSGLPLA